MVGCGDFGKRNFPSADSSPPPRNGPYERNSLGGGDALDERNKANRLWPLNGRRSLDHLGRLGDGGPRCEPGLPGYGCGGSARGTRGTEVVVVARHGARLGDRGCPWRRRDLGSRPESLEGRGGNDRESQKEA